MFLLVVILYQDIYTRNYLYKIFNHILCKYYCTVGDLSWVMIPKVNWQSTIEMSLQRNWEFLPSTNFDDRPIPFEGKLMLGFKYGLFFSDIFQLNRFSAKKVIFDFCKTWKGRLRINQPHGFKYGHLEWCQGKHDPC